MQRQAGLGCAAERAAAHGGAVPARVPGRVDQCRQLRRGLLKVLQCLDGETPNAVHEIVRRAGKGGRRAIVTSNSRPTVRKALFAQRPAAGRTSRRRSSRWRWPIGWRADSPARRASAQAARSVEEPIRWSTRWRSDACAGSSGHLQCDALPARSATTGCSWLPGADPEANSAVPWACRSRRHRGGLSWLVRDDDACVTVPLSVTRIVSLFGERGELLRGELPRLAAADLRPLAGAGRRPCCRHAADALHAGAHEVPGAPHA